MDDESKGIDYSDAIWAADALAAMLERVRRMVAAEYVRRIADLQAWP